MIKSRYQLVLTYTGILSVLSTGDFARGFATEVGALPEEILQTTHLL